MAMFNLEMEKEQLVRKNVIYQDQVTYEKVLKPWSMNENDWVKVAESGQLAAHDIYIYDTIFKIEGNKKVYARAQVKRST